MKVYQGVVIDWSRSSEKFHGQCRAIIAAKSWKAAHEAMVKRYSNMSLGHMLNFWTITGNELQIAAASKHPGRVLLSSSAASDDYKLV